MSELVMNVENDSSSTVEFAGTPLFLSLRQARCVLFKEKSVNIYLISSRTQYLNIILSLIYFSTACFGHSIQP